MITVTKEFKVTGLSHRLVMGYVGKCNSLHGHNWIIRVTLGADDLNTFGFVQDFSDFKIFKTWLDENWDHAFLLWEGDHEAIEALRKVEGQRLVLFPLNPTSENIAMYLGEEILPRLFEKEGVWVERVEVEETDSSKATWSD